MAAASGLCSRRIATAAVVAGSFLYEHNSTHTHAYKNVHGSGRSFGQNGIDRRTGCVRCDGTMPNDNGSTPTMATAATTTTTAAVKTDIPHPPTITWWNRTLATMYLSSLPLPRMLLPNDPAFSDSALRRGLRQRELDEAKLRQIQQRFEQFRGKPHNQEEENKLFAQVTEIAYGKGVTPQQREDFLVVRLCWSFVLLLGGMIAIVGWLIDWLLCSFWSCASSLLYSHNPPHRCFSFLSLLLLLLLLFRTAIWLHWLDTGNARSDVGTREGPRVC